MEDDLEIFTFASDIITTYKYLVFEKKEFIISKRLLKSGTGIEAHLARDEKLTAYKMAVETEFWLKFLEIKEICEAKLISGLNKKLRSIINGFYQETLTF